MQDINISTIIGSTVPVEEQLKLIKNAGFDGFFLTYTGIEPLVSWAETAYQLGLKFETIHGPFSQANRIWEAGDIGKDYLTYLKKIIDDCHSVNVDKLIMHVTVGNTAPPISSNGLILFQEL